MSDHEWCRDVRRDEAIRAEEDAAAVPAIQHRDLPEVVAALTERVARLEAAEKQAASTEAMRCMTKMRRERDDARAERDAAIRERDEAKKECERLRAKIVAMEGQSRMETEAEIAVEEAWERCGIAPYWPDDEPGTSHRYAKSMEAEIVRLRARVAELEANANTATILAKIRDSEWSVASELAAEANAELSAAPPPRGWLTAEERDAVADASETLAMRGCGSERRSKILKSLLARETPPKVKGPTGWAYDAHDMAWIAAIRAAGVEVD